MWNKFCPHGCGYIHLSAATPGTLAWWCCMLLCWRAFIIQWHQYWWNPLPGFNKWHNKRNKTSYLATKQMKFVALRTICRETEFCAEPSNFNSKLPHTTHNTKQCTRWAQYCPTAIDNTMNIEPIALYQVSLWGQWFGLYFISESIFIGFDPCEAGVSGDGMFCTSLSRSITMQKVCREMSEFTQFLATIPSQGSFQIWMSPTNKL